jgi:hypothetical protein
MEDRAKCGPASPNAKVAWDTVEEISAGTGMSVGNTHKSSLLLSVLHATVVESYSNHLPVLNTLDPSLYKNELYVSINSKSQQKSALMHR